MKMKYTPVMTAQVGSVKVSFTGREPFRVDDEKDVEALLSIGIFEKLEDGALRYSGRITVYDKDGGEHFVDKDGYLDAPKSKFDPKLLKEQFV